MSDKFHQVTAQQRSRLIRSGRLHWFHWLIISLSLLLTLGAWHTARTQVDEKNSIRFHNDADQVLELVAERMRKYEDGLWGGVGAIQAVGGAIDHAGWLTFAETLSIDTKYPGINGIGVIYQVDAEEREAFIAEQRRERPDFRIHPEHGYDEYLPITYIEPALPNRAAIGLDMAYEGTRYGAARQARDSGAAQITGPIVLVQDAQRTPGFLFFAPFYRGRDHATEAARREHFTGLVYAPFVVRKLMQGVLARKKRQVSLRIADDGEVLYDELLADEPDFDADQLFRKQVQLPMYGRIWNFDVRSGRSFRASADNDLPPTILIAGLLIDATLLALFLLLTHANRKALRYAEEATSELARSLRHERELEARIEADRRFRQMVMSAPGAMLMTRDDGRIVLVNDQATRLFGYAESALLDTWLQELIPTPGPAPASWWEAYGDETGACGDLQALHRAGHRVPVEIGVNMIEIEGERMLLAVVVDVTEREMAKRDLAERAAELSRSNAELDSFANIASHDLKAPLRAIKTLATFIREDAGELMPEQTHADLDLLCARVQRMENLLDGLLQFSRIGEGDGGAELVATAEVVDDVIALCLPPAGFVVEAQPGMPAIFAPQAMVHLVFRNLISNAIKHHDRDRGRVDIAWEADADFVTFTITDDGPGIDPRDAERVFDLFSTLRPRDEMEGGGLGLALVRKAVNLYGGRIELVSHAGRGATFRLLWPRRDGQAKQAA